MARALWELSESGEAASPGIREALVVRTVGGRLNVAEDFLVAVVNCRCFVFLLIIDC